MNELSPAKLAELNGRLDRAEAQLRAILGLSASAPLPDTQAHFDALLIKRIDAEVKTSVAKNPHLHFQVRRATREAVVPFLKEQFGISDAQAQHLIDHDPAFDVPEVGSFV